MSGHRYNAKKNQGNRRYHIEDDECPFHKTRVDGERSPSATAAGEPSPAEAKEQRISASHPKQKGRRLLAGERVGRHGRRTLWFVATGGLLVLAWRMASSNCLML